MSPWEAGTRHGLNVIVGFQQSLIVVYLNLNASISKISVAVRDASQCQPNPMCNMNKLISDRWSIHHSLGYPLTSDALPARES